MTLNKVLTFILAGLLSLPALAEVAYIDDTLFVPLRSGAGTGFRIVHKGIKSGTPLEIINADKDTGYSQVRTKSGIEGFLPSRYLTKEPIAKAQLASATEKLAKALADNKKLRSELGKLSTEHRKLNQAHESSLKQLDNKSDELTNIKSISANAINLDSRNKELHQSNEQLRNELELIQAENLRLKDKSESNMMIIGGGLVTLGVIIALLAPMLKPSKKNESWA